MHDRNPDRPAADRIVAHVARLIDHRDDLLQGLDAAQQAMWQMQQDLEDIRREAAENRTELLRIMTMPSGRP
jgi:DNA anti-recombination protein RmuC